jgi:hypothetical protein
LPGPVPSAPNESQPDKRLADQAPGRHLRPDPAPVPTGRTFREGEAFRREDLCEEAWAARNENIQPFSFWKSRYEPPPPVAPEPLAKENAEELLRRLLAENDPANANACYVLAVMLERKRVLKQVKTEQTEGRAVLVYEHAKTGDVFIVPEAQLRLAEIAHVQEEVAELLRRAS